MKKFLCTIMVLVMMFLITACQSILPSLKGLFANGSEEADVAADGAALVVEEESDEEELIAEEDVTEDEEVTMEEEPVEEELIPSGWYDCYDRFSGEMLTGFYIEMLESNSTQAVFNYSNSHGVFEGVIADLDGAGHATVDLTETLTLEITFYEYEIHVDELEGMGAMAYVFK